MAPGVTLGWLECKRAVALSLFMGAEPRRNLSADRPCGTKCTAILESCGRLSNQIETNGITTLQLDELQAAEAAADRAWKCRSVNQWDDRRLTATTTRTTDTEARIDRRIWRFFIFEASSAPATTRRPGVLTSYLVSNAIILPASSYLTTFIGRKKFYMICVVLFGVSSMLCGLAPSLGWLVFFRVLQGAGGGGRKLCRLR